MTFVEVCGVSFSGDHNPVAGLVYQKLIDWDGRPDARGGGEAVPGSHGDYGRSSELRNSRVITVNAAIVANSAEEYFAAKSRVENMPMFGDMRVDQGDGAWSRQVEVAHIGIPDAHTRTFSTFTIDLVAPDPVRYRDMETAGPVGLPMRSGGLVLPAAFPWSFGTASREVADVVNMGTVPVYPRITVRGSAVSLLVRGGPYRLEYGAFDGVLVFDSLERRAWLNGVDVTRSLVRRDWPVVPAGATAGFSFEAVVPSPEISLLVEYRIGVW